MSYTLTRLLYAKDEVMLSLLTELLMKNDLQACLFWCGELCYSNVEKLFDFIWKLYFDFYAEYNPHLERYIQKKQLLWEKDKNIKHILIILYNMFYLNSSPTTFLLRISVEKKNKPVTLYRKSSHKKWDWLKIYPQCYHSLLKALFKKHLSNAATFLKQLLLFKTSKDVYDVLIQYYSEYILLVNKNIIEEKWLKRGWYNDFHGLLSLIVHLQTPYNKIQHPLVFKIPPQKIIQNIEDLNNEIINRHIKNEKVYRILKDFRLFTINDMIGVFLLARNSFDDLSIETNYHWEYYANNCPMWSERFIECGAKFNHKKTDIHDKGIENYDLEFDEQSFNVKNMSTCKIKNMTLENWVRTLFNVTPHIFVHGKINY